MPVAHQFNWPSHDAPTVDETWTQVGLVLDESMSVVQACPVAHRPEVVPTGMQPEPRTPLATQVPDGLPNAANTHVELEPHWL